MACEPPPSARHAGRASAWCRGGFVRQPHERLGYAADHSDICMLAPVHGPNFERLSYRLEQTERLAVGPVPTTVAVFDDEGESASFCRKFPRSCAMPHFVRLNLKALVGNEAYRAASGMLRTGGSASRAKLRDRLYGGDELAQECFPKFGGQCYQSLKKFYGAADGPSRCRVYWVSDAETFPFRPFNWSELVAKTVSRPAAANMVATTPLAGAALPDSPSSSSSFAAGRRHLKPYLLVPSWHANRYGCGGTSNLYDDADCAVWISARLGLDAAVVDHGGASARKSGRADERGAGRVGALPTSGAYQTIYDLNNWWFYERTMARALIDRTEATMNQHFVPYFASLQVPDINFWRANFEYLSKQPGSTMASRDYLKLVEKAFPDSFAQCCACTRPAANWRVGGGLRESIAASGGKGGSKGGGGVPLHAINASTDLLPCYALSHLWSPCFRAHASAGALASFLVDTLGIFGIFGNEMDLVPDDVLKADSRLSWVVNNAYYWKGAFKYVKRGPQQGQQRGS